jgi:trans-2,3-dihydro-3-hydroxyanthranilate isomerase
MLSIAREMNQSETAFLMKSQTADLRARYFTPEREIPLAGHPTIASIHAALELGWLSANQAEISLELNEGPIRVGLEESPEGLLIRMFQRKPVFGEIHDPASFAWAERPRRARLSRGIWAFRPTRWRTLSRAPRPEGWRPT